MDMKERTISSFEAILESLDRDSRTLLYNLWYHGHLNISQLRELIDAPSDFAIIDKLERTINRTALEITGRPLVAFRECCTDPSSGRKIFYNWWLVDEEEFAGMEEPLIDLFEEKDSIAIITQLRSAVDMTKAELSMKNGILMIRLKKKK